MNFWSRAVLVLAVAQSLVSCDALKIQNPADDLPKELNNPKYIRALEVGYLNLDNVVGKLYEPDNLFGNIELINGMLESERKNPFLLKGVKRLDETVDLFLSLSTVYESCDYESYKSLAQNYRAVDGRSHDLHENRRAIEKMIYDYALEHAKECGPKYAEKFEEISQRVATKIVAQIVDQVFKGLDAQCLLAGEDGGATVTRFKPENVIEMDSHGLNLDNYGFHTIVKNIESLVQGKSEAEFFYPKLGKHSNSKPSLPKEFEANIYEKYLVVPCQQYNELFREVFAPARFDAMIEGDEVESIFPSKSEKFNTAWIQYRACKHLASTADRGDILSMVKQVAKSLTRRPE